jgi:hypothetical protein
MHTAIASVSEGAASVGAPVDAVAATTRRLRTPWPVERHPRPHGGLSHTPAATRGLVVLAAVMGAMLVAMADQIARAIRVAPRQTLDLGAWLPLPSADTPAAGLRLAYGRCARPQRSAVIVAATLATG